MVAQLPTCALGVPIFQALPQAGLAKLAEFLRHIPVERGQVVAATDDPITDLIIVARGRLKSVHASQSGREQVVRTMQPGDFIGELALFTDARHESDLIALEDGQVCLVPRTGMQTILQQHPEVAAALVVALAQRLAAAERRIGDLGLRDVGQRLAAELLRLAETAPDGSQTVHLTGPWAEIAQRLGTTPESISRRLKSLADRGLIEQVDNRTVRLLQPQQLVHLADL